MDKIKELFKTLAANLGLGKKKAAMPEQAHEGEQNDGQAKSMEGVAQARTKASGSGLNRKYVIGLVCVVIGIALYSMLAGAGREGSHLSSAGETKTETAQPVGSGNHLKNVPGNYTEEGKLEKDKNAKAAVKEEKPVKEKAVQPRPTLPRQPARQEKPRMTLEQQERMEEYEAMKKAYQSPIKFELKE